MSKYWIKKGTLSKKELPNAQPIEEIDKVSSIEEDEAEEVQGAFFAGEDSTKVFSSNDVDTDVDNELSELFNGKDSEKKPRVKLAPFLSKSKAEKEFSEELLNEVDKVYSGEHVKSIEETLDNDHMAPFNELNKKKKPKPSRAIELDGDDDEYETEVTSLDGLFSDDESDDDDYDYELEEKTNKQQKIEEYTSREQREEFLGNYRRRSRNAFISALLCLVFTVLLFLHESPAFPHPEWLTQGKYGILYLLFDLQCLMFAAVCSYKVFVKGAKALFSWNPSKYSVAFLLEIVALLQILLHLFFDRANDSTILFSSIAALSAFFCAFAEYLDTRREGISFRVATADTPKIVANTLTESSEEFTSFEEYLPDEAYLYSLGRTEFVKDFVKTSNKSSTFGEIYKILLPLLVFTSVLFAVIANIMSGVPTFGKTVDNFVLAIMISTPIASVLSVSLPFIKGITALSKAGSTVIGESSLDSCSAANVISFNDTDAFHAKGIVLNTVKPFGSAQIDTAIFTAARVFNLVGGPLKDVFNRSIIESGSSGNSVDDEIIQILPNSILSLIDGRKVLLGTKLAVKSVGAICPDDPVDSMFENSGGRIMYMLIDDELSAKFYIKYSLGRNFKAILDKFYNAGIFMAIKSCDPNLDTEYLTRLLRDENYPIVVNKLNEIEYINTCEVTEEASAPIVSNKSIPLLLRAFAWCDKCRHIINLNNLVRFVAVVLSVIILIACMLNANSHEKITPLIVMIYQLIWAIPVFGTSLFQ